VSVLNQDDTGAGIGGFSLGSSPLIGAWLTQCRWHHVQGEGKLVTIFFDQSYRPEGDRLWGVHLLWVKRGNEWPRPGRS